MVKNITLEVADELVLGIEHLDARDRKMYQAA